jgi:hypothetical protein
MNDMQPLIDWLKEHVSDGDTIAWGQDHLIHAGVATGWVDVVVPAITAELRWGWVWTVGDADEEGDVDLPLVQDVVIWRTWDEETHWFVAEPAVLTGVGEALSAEQRALFGTDEVVAVPGWRLETISRALEQWCLDHTGLRLNFVYLDAIESPHATQVREQIEAASEGEVYEIAPGIMASERFFDALLAMDPEDRVRLSGEIVTALGPIVEGLRSDDEDEESL